MFDRAAHALDARLRARLTDWENAGLLRTLAPPAGIDLSSNDYLQLSSHPDVVSRFAEAVRQAGAGSTGSRLLRGEREVFANAGVSEATLDGFADALAATLRETRVTCAASS